MLQTKAQASHTVLILYYTCTCMTQKAWNDNDIIFVNSNTQLSDFIFDLFNNTLCAYCNGLGFDSKSNAFTLLLVFELLLFLFIPWFADKLLSVLKLCCNLGFSTLSIIII